MTLCSVASCYSCGDWSDAFKVKSDKSEQSTMSIVCKLGTWAFHQCCMQTVHLVPGWASLSMLVSSSSQLHRYYLLSSFRQAYIQFQREDKLYSCGGAVVSNRCWWSQKITITTTMVRKRIIIIFFFSKNKVCDDCSSLHRARRSWLGGFYNHE